MKKSTSLLAVVLGLVVALAPVGAHAVDDYSDPGITVEIPSDELYGGDDVTVTVSANTTCDWTLAFLDQTAQDTSESFTHTFSTPVVQERTEVPLYVTCEYDAVPSSAGTSAGGAATATQAATFVVPAATANRQGTIVLLPRDAGDSDDPAGAGDANGILPGTGGPTPWLLAAGGVLVAAGGALTIARKRS